MSYNYWLNTIPEMRSLTRDRRVEAWHDVYPAVSDLELVRFSAKIRDGLAASGAVAGVLGGLLLLGMLGILVGAFFGALLGGGIGGLINGLTTRHAARPLLRSWIRKREQVH